MFKQGDIILTKFPFSNLTDAKLRPAIVISNNNLNKGNDFVCLQITSKQFDDGYFFKLEEKQLQTPLKLDSGIRLQKIFTVNNSVIERKISSMLPDYCNEVINSFKSKVL